MTTTTTLPPEINNGVTTTWLPVTSAWFSVSQCETAIYTQFSGGMAIAYDPFYGLNIDTQLTCLPPAVTKWWNQTQQIPAQTVTSLGPLVCPSQYWIAATQVVNSISTSIACCPSAFTFAKIFEPSTVGECKSPLTSGQAFTYMSLNSTVGTWVQTTTVVAANDGFLFAVPVNGYIFSTPTPNSFANANSTTTIISTPAALPTTAIPAPTTILPSSQSMTITSPSIPSPSLEQTTSNNSLSPNTKIGIGVGVALCVLGICSLLGAIYLLRRRSTRSFPQPQPSPVALSAPSENTALKASPQLSTRTNTTPSRRWSWKHEREMGQGQQDMIFELGATTPRMGL